MSAQPVLVSLLTSLFSTSDEYEWTVQHKKDQFIRETSTLPSLTYGEMKEITEKYYKQCIEKEYGYLILDFILDSPTEKWCYNNGDMKFDDFLEDVLTYAAEKNNENVVKLLLNKGVRNERATVIDTGYLLSPESGKKLTRCPALNAAIKNNNLRIVKIISEKMRDRDALFYSLSLGRNEITEFLLTKKYEMPKIISYEMLKNSRDFFENREWNKTQKLYFAAIDDDNPEMLKFIFSKTSIKDMPYFISEGMAYASKLNKLDCVKVLNEFSKNQQEFFDNNTNYFESMIVTSLKEAARKNSRAVVEYLLLKYTGIAKKNMENIRHEALRNTHTDLALYIETTCR